MRSRFVLIPVLHPLREDLPGIVTAIAGRIAGNISIDADDSTVLEAANIFYDKGASPRHVRSALSNALLLHGELAPKVIRFAAQDLCASIDLQSTVYSDLWAIAVLIEISK